MRVGALLAIALAAAPARAEWVSTISFSHEKAAWIQRESVVARGSYYRVWVKSVFPAPQESPGWKAYRSIKALHLVDCKEKRIALLAAHGFTDDAWQMPAGSYTKPEATDPALEDVVPDSQGDARLYHICLIARTKPP